ncbi:MAG: cytochrome c biogenesis protein ResB [Vulcanimicrobiaceae bacterium]
MEAIRSTPAPAAAAPTVFGLRGKLGEALYEILRSLSDFWFGMSLLGIWGFLTLIGVIVEQGHEPSYYFANYSAPLARLIVRLDLQNIYHSAVYIGIIGLIIACMTLATFWRVIPTRMPSLRPVKIEHIPLNASIELPGDEASVRARVEHFFVEQRWLVRKREDGGTVWTFADKHNWARRGVLVAHVGFVIIAVGTTLYWAFGYSGQTPIITGQTVTIPQNGDRFRLLHFRYRYEPIATRGGLVYQPIDYVSKLETTDRAGQTRIQTLRVNDPLSLDGTLYYQASYGFAVPFTLLQDGRSLANVPSRPLMEGEGFQVGDGTRSIRYQRFVGTIGPNGSIGADPRPNSPGVVLDLFDGDAQLGSILVPLDRTVDLGDGYRLHVGGYTLYSGIQYRHDPGIPFVAVGAFVLLAGLCISFYLLPARLFVRIDPGTNGGSKVGIAAVTVKGYEIFEEQFEALVRDLERTGAPA